MSADDEYRALIAEVWPRVRPSIEARVAAVVDAVRAEAAGTLDEARREEARTQAHRLAGSLGTYGFTAAGETARRIEAMLGSRSGTAAVLEAAASELANALP